MDYNFVVSKSNKKPSPQYRQALIKFLRMFVPVFMLATFLPFLVILTLKPSDLRFLTKADREAELRVWIEPETIIASPNEKVEFSVKAELEDETMLIPTIDLEVASTGNLKFEKQTVSYKKPFRGTITLGKVIVNTKSTGTFTLSVPEDKINITAFTEPIEIITGPAKLIVR